MAYGRKLESQGNTPLHDACSCADYDRVLMLLLQGASASARNIWLQTPLHLCIRRGDLHVMLLLLDSGAEVNAKDSDFVSPLYQAVVCGRAECLELLLCYGASPYNPEGTVGHLSPLELSESAPKCHVILENATDVFPLQHLCRIAIRRCMGVARRRRIKELPLPPHLISYLCSLPVLCSDQLHEGWIRTKSGKDISVKTKHAARRPKTSKYVGIHQIRQPPSFDD